MFQTIGDNPVTAYRQLVQQFAKDATGNAVHPKIAQAEANAVFRMNPAGAGKLRSCRGRLILYTLYCWCLVSCGVLH